jgi:ADP-dependent NAD(P)H-hydrate dehydratase
MSITSLDKKELKRRPLPAAEAGDKHSHGKLLVVAGSRDLGGAALLTGTAALRSGVGKIQIATVASVAPPLVASIPEALVRGYPAARDGGFAGSAIDDIVDMASDSDAVVAGPGMMPIKASERLAAALCECVTPLVLDAGLLRVLPARRSAARQAAGLPILLPHSGELAALLKCDEADVAADPLKAGRECADRYEALVLVKGPQSHVVAPNGATWRYRGGGPGLGVSGSGDALAGVIGGLLARGAEPLTALLWGVSLHGEAGRALARKIGPLGFLAREIPGEIPAILAKAQ